MAPRPKSNPVVGIFWMIFTGLCFVAVTALVKFLGTRIPAPQAAFLRYVMGLIFIVPLLGTALSARIDRTLWIQFGTRGICHAIGVMLWFFAMTRIPLADLTALNYLAPVYVTIGAALFLGERLAIRRIAAVVAALIGAMIILRPGMRELDLGHIAMMAAAVVFGVSYLLAKVTVDKTEPALVVTMLSIWVTVALFPFAVANWVPLVWTEIGLLFGVAFFATLGHYTMTLALAAAPVAVTQPVTFLQLVWASMLGVLVFGEVLDIWVVIGGAVILGAVSFITWRETVLKRQPVTPPVPATKV